MTNETGERRLGRSVLALLAGLVVVVVLSIGTDAVLRALHIFPLAAQPLGDAKLFVLAIVYRSLYGVIGSYVTARVAPYRPMAHALTGGAIGTVLSLLGVVAAWNHEATLGPLWYPIALVLTALPGAWLGGWLVEKK